MGEEQNKGTECAKEGVRRRRRRAKNGRKKLAVLFVLVLLLSAVGIGVGVYLLTPSNERVSHADYFQKTDEQYGLIFNTEMLEGVPIQKEGFWYLAFADLYYTICNEFYYDGFSLLYTNPVKTFSVKPGEAFYTDDDGMRYQLSYQPCFFQDKKLYIALEYLQLMDYSYYSVDESFGSIWIQNDWSELARAYVEDDTAMRHMAGIKKPIVADLAAGEAVTVLEQDGKWSKVQNQTGLVGYVKSGSLRGIGMQAAETPDGRVLPEYTSIKMDGNVVMGWHQMFSGSGYDELADIIETAKGMNVICPTWFTIQDTKGNIRNMGEKAYVEMAHEAGLQVWVMLDDINIRVDGHQVFGTTEHRKNLVNNVISALKELDADGVNVDVECIKSDTGPSFLQFLRELSAACRNEHLVLSVDNYSPMPHTAFYDRKQQGEIVDYVVVMAYDEHYAGGKEAGSTSSLSFVDRSASKTIDQVPAEKVIVGLPFFTRLWKETPAQEAPEDMESGAVFVDNTEGTYTSVNQKYVLSSRGLNMVGMKKIISDQELSLTWKADVGQYYADYEEDGSYYQLWIEDASSIDQKLQTVMKYRPGGVAFFKVGNEDQEVWTIIRKHMTSR